MKVICSGGLYDEIEVEGCLACARELILPPCGYTADILGKVLDSEDRQEVHVTDVTGCLLKSYLDKTSPAPRYVHDHLVLWLGKAVHSALEGEDSEVAIEYDGLVGRIDKILPDGSILDYKTTRWLDINKIPYGEHVTQVNLYAYMRERLGFEVPRLFIAYIDLSGPRRCKLHNTTGVVSEGRLVCPACNVSLHGGVFVKEVPKYEPEYMGIVFDRARQLRECLENEIPPEPEPSWLCAYCPHSSCPFNQRRNYERIAEA